MSNIKLIAIERAIASLKDARDTLSAVGVAPRVLLRIRAAIKSAEGARLHQRLAPHRYERTGEQHAS